MPVSDSARLPKRPSREPDCTVLTGDTYRLAEAAEAVILVDKPPAWTSGQVVRLLRRSVNARKVGHAGTLDPMATGLLICMTGRCTKLSSYFLEMEKEYVGTMRLGETTPSYDSDTPVDDIVPADHVTREEVEVAAARRLGDIVQRTPPYSAVRVGGRRLYHRARGGDRRSGPPRIVTIDRFDITGKRGNDLDFRLVCSKGTYVRALAHELGQELGVGAHLVRLRRTRIGPHDVSNSIRPQDLDIAGRDGPSENRSRRGSHAG